MNEYEKFNKENPEVIKLPPIQQLRFWGLVINKICSYKEALTHEALQNEALYFELVYPGINHTDEP